MIPSFIHSQREFGGGQIDSAARRRDDQDFLRTGGRKMSNWRRRATGGMEPRPGRWARFQPAGQRVEYVRMAPDKEYFICFSGNAVSIYDAGTLQKVFVNATSTYLWTDADLATIVWCQAQTDIIVCYPQMRPQVLSWDSDTSTWSASAFVFVTQAGVTKAPFYRFSVPGATMTYSGNTGSVTLTCSQDYFKPSMVGIRLSIMGCQVTITAVSSTTVATATVATRLPDWIDFTVTDCTYFMPGQVIETANTGVKIEVGAVTVGSAPAGVISGCMMYPHTFNASIFSGDVFTGPTGDLLVGPYGKTTISAVAKGATPRPTVQWSEEFMSMRQGWPQGCAYDAGRIIFFDFPQMPEAILWGSLYGPRFFWVDAGASSTDNSAGADASSAILEFISPSGRARPRVRHVVGWGDEFVFTDVGIFYVPISSSNPLKPGSVEFREITRDSCSSIRPVQSNDCILYINAGLNRVAGLIRTGGYSTPYVGQDMTELHTSLFKTPTSMVLTSGDGSVPERYVYVANADGSVAVGVLTKTEGKIAIGWVPFYGAAPTKWITANMSSKVYYVTDYSGNLIVEVEDTTAHIDGCVYLNNPPAALAVSGLGPVWWLAGKSVTLMNGDFDMGERQVDERGNVVSVQGEDLSASTIVAGIMFPSPVFEPFVPGPADGADQGQRVRRKRSSQLAVFYSGKTDLTLHNKTFPAYRFGDDTTVAPPWRDMTARIKPLGRSHEPRYTITKPRPGPCRIVEVTLEATI